MADITFQCPECKQPLVVDAGGAGQQIQCPTCFRSITVPPSSTQAKTPSSPESALDPTIQKSKFNNPVIKVIAVIAVVVPLIIVTVQGICLYNRSQCAAYFRSGCDKCSKGDYDGSIGDLTKSIAFAPDYVDAYFSRGYAKHIKGDLDGAIADYTKVIELNPGIANAYDNRGIAKQAKGDLDDALADYNTAISYNPNDPDFYCNRGITKQAKSDSNGAFTDYSMAIKLKPDYAEPYYARGDLENSRGDYGDALADYDKAIQLKPDFADAIRSRAKLKAEHREATPTPNLAAIKARFQEILDGNIQVKDNEGFSHTVSAAQHFFDCIHPIGTARSITVDYAVLNKGESGKIQSVGLRLVLYWDGPLKSGSTTFQTLYDLASDQFVSLSVVRTDGITRQDIENFAAGYQIGAQIHDAFSGN